MAWLLAKAVQKWECVERRAIVVYLAFDASRGGCATICEVPVASGVSIVTPMRYGWHVASDGS